MKIIHREDGGYDVFAEEPEIIIHSSSDNIVLLKSLFIKSIEDSFDKAMIQNVNKQLKSVKGDQ